MSSRRKWGLLGEAVFVEALICVSSGKGSRSFFVASTKVRRREFGLQGCVQPHCTHGGFGSEKSGFLPPPAPLGYVVPSLQLRLALLPPSFYRDSSSIASGDILCCNPVIRPGRALTELRLEGMGVVSCMATAAAAAARLACTVTAHSPALEI